MNMKIAAAMLMSVCVVFGASSVDDGNMLDSLMEALMSKDRRSADFKQLVKDFKNKKLDKILPNFDNLECPIPDTWFPTTLKEKEFKLCDHQLDCSGSGQLCCAWWDKQHCMEGINTEPRDGQCPAITQLNDACIADFVGCRYDAECANEDEKCCENTNCHYKECLSIRQNLGCPIPDTTLPTKRDDKKCVKDVQCGNDEKCCDWFEENYCLKGIDTSPRPGFCPNFLPSELKNCKADHTGCFHDKQCSGKQDKCCFNSGCGYHECMDMNLEFACPTMNFDSNSQKSSSKNSCETNSDCDSFTTLCCAVDGKSSKECRNGLHIVPKEGQCPDAKTTSSAKGDKCTSGSKGDCEYDSECPGQEQCCLTKCNYKQCVILPGTKDEIKGDQPVNNEKRESDVLEQLLTALNNN